MAAVDTTVKNASFQSTPLEVVPLIDVPGVGPAALAKLEKKKITNAVQLMGQFFLMNRDEKEMSKWLVKEVDLREQDTEKIVKPLAEKSVKCVAS